MAAIQIDGVDVTLVFPDSEIEKVISLPLSAGSIVSQNYTVSIQSPYESATSSGAETSKESWEE